MNLNVITQVNSISHFRQLSLIKKLMLKVVAFTLSPKQIEQLREDFYAIDTDRNGTISMQELRDALLRKNQTHAQVEEIMRKMEDGVEGTGIYCLFRLLSIMNTCS